MHDRVTTRCGDNQSTRKKIFKLESIAHDLCLTATPAMYVFQQPMQCVLARNLRNCGSSLSFLPMSKATIKTAKGDMVVEFFDTDAPNTVENFRKLAAKGYYNGLNFHRVIPDFVIQGGCPSGTGSGGPGYQIKCETSGDNQRHDRGVLSMAHAGPNTGGSQFFVCHSRKNTAHLDRKHTCFGKVVQGLEVIDAIVAGDKIVSIELAD